MSIDMMTPLQTVCCEGKINKRWVSYREKAIDQKRTIGKITENTLPIYMSLRRSLSAIPCSQPLNEIKLRKTTNFRDNDDQST